MVIVLGISTLEEHEYWEGGEEMEALTDILQTYMT